MGLSVRVPGCQTLLMMAYPSLAHDATVGVKGLIAATEANLLCGYIPKYIDQRCDCLTYRRFSLEVCYMTNPSTNSD